VKKAAQTPPASGGSPAENRPQKTQPTKDSAKVNAPPAAKNGADSSLVGSDGEKAYAVQQLDPARPLSSPSENTDEAAHGHSPQIRWPAVDAAVPWKGLK
jgi:hypothetical protein